jgi:hypothetical protein
MIHGRLRENLSQEDIRFVVTTLAQEGAEADGLLKLLTDVAMRDQILEDPGLYEAVARATVPLKFSLELYFYICLRKWMKEAGLLRIDLSAFMAEALAKFPPRPKPGVHTSDYVEVLNKARDYEWFCLNVELGNRALILSSIYAETIYKPKKIYKVAGLNYYENLGRACYHNASKHKLAEEFELKGTLKILADEFVRVRAVLKDSMREPYMKVVKGI